MPIYVNIPEYMHAYVSIRVYSKYMFFFNHSCHVRKHNSNDSVSQKREKKERAEQFHQEASQAGRRAVAGAGAGGAAAVTDSAYGNNVLKQGVTQYHGNAPPYVADGHVNPAFDPDHPPVYPNQ